MPTPILDREEYIEQAYLFRVYRERLAENIPSQEILQTIHEEILATTKLPMAVEFLKLEIEHTGRMSGGMGRLSHYFTAFQTFVMERAEDDKSRFDQKIALEVLEKEAEYKSQQPTPQGLFVYQFECIARNRLGYDRGMTAMAEDAVYDDHWRRWIRKARLELGTTDFANLIYRRSEHFVDQRRRKTGRDDYMPRQPVLFGLQEGRIAKANRGRDPLYMFAALQRQLGYPTIPRSIPKSTEPTLHPAVEQRLQRLEQRLKLLESEVKGQFDISQFYVKKPEFHDDGLKET